MNILLLGKTGQVGFELHRTLTPLGTITAPDRTELDLMTPQAVADYLETHQPDLIANAAAWTAVDAAEEHTEAARRLNAGLPDQLARYSAEQGAVLIHYSSDYVYPGSGTQPWQETSATGPLSVYGQTKLEGDQAIQNSGAEHLIFRTSWVYSARGNNFMKTMLRLAKSKPELKIVADQVGAPTPARLIAQVTALAIGSNMPNGLYHLAPKGETSWHGFAQEIFRLAHQAGEQLSMGPQNAAPIPTSEFPTPAKRPLNSRMDLTKLEAALNMQMPDWQSQLALTLREYLDK
ncbi:dTDP-4-dehydrorhamnose reductase [Marinobacter sp. LV10MA510-1]|uniref:dTDP-4-dehydrorhamnose reductase n=1 Tax=Marinobacter sp. LV10MA510-1 TaxID=1415567 RepID=UPI000BF6D238|nr:dTDP-4-dehydrorhamnose reductase [Marinobacter sp. LV10MA510-1]PFG08987.1 dTDP-4-dehydrorhamnose reductase [Marinobacter sp. LV10MA510-1]